MFSKLKGTLIFVGCFLIAALIVMSRPEVPPAEAKPKSPIVVKTVTVANIIAPVRVSSQGNVSAKYRTVLTSRVGGTVLRVSKNFVKGGEFRKGETMLKIEEIDYSNAVAQSKLNLAQAEENLAKEQAAAQNAKSQWVDLGNDKANAIFLRKPQIKRAIASIVAAKQQLKRAKLDLQRTTIVSPFAGKIISVNANIGQFLNSQAVIATIYKKDKYLVEVPLSNFAIGLLKLLDETTPNINAEVVLSDGREIVAAKFSHTIGAVDVNSRLVNTILQVDSPKLLPGMFINVNLYSDYQIPQFEISKKALYQQDKVFVFVEDKLEARTVNVINSLKDTVIVSGLKDGEQLVVSKPLWSKAGDTVQVLEL